MVKETESTVIMVLHKSLISHSGRTKERARCPFAQAMLNGVVIGVLIRYYILKEIIANAPVILTVY